MKKISLVILCVLMITCTPDRKKDNTGKETPEKEIIRENIKEEVDIPQTEKEVITDNISNGEKPLVTVEQMPSFKGGEAEMLKFISNNMKYPASAKENGIQGRVTVRFVITSAGKITDVQIIRGIDPACDKEAIRIVKSMPDWEPGKQNGKAVSVYYTLPIKFSL